MLAKRGSSLAILLSHFDPICPIDFFDWEHGDVTDLAHQRGFVSRMYRRLVAPAQCREGAVEAPYFTFRFGNLLRPPDPRADIKNIHSGR